jgi:hypothetical protein
MNKSLVFLLVISLNAFSVENCNFEDSTEKSDIEKFKPNLSESEAIKISEKTVKRKKVSIPEGWCRDISLEKKEEKLNWKVFYTGEELDACFFIVIDDKTKKSYIEYCA